MVKSYALEQESHLGWIGEINSGRRKEDNAYSSSFCMRSVLANIREKNGA